jgi:hypothetical protein
MDGVIKYRWNALPDEQREVGLCTRLYKLNPVDEP